MKEVLPPMLGPVRTMQRWASLRMEIALGTNGSVIRASTTGCRPSTISNYTAHTAHTARTDRL
jgi:hypothetical protein